MENVTLIIVKSSSSSNSGTSTGNSNQMTPESEHATSKPRNRILAGMTFVPKVKAAPVTTHIPMTPVTQTIKPRKDTVVPKTSLVVNFFGAGLAACIAEVVTFPLDTAKVRLQIQGEGGSIAATAIKDQTGSIAKKLEFQGVFGTLSTLAQKEGIRAWYQGITAGLQRQMCFVSVRIGLYDVIKQKYCNLFNTSPNHTNFHIRILAGITSGALAITCFQPTDVVKTRLQAQTSGKKRYRGAVHAYMTIATQERITGLWKGVAPNITRNCIVNVSELVTYDLFKEYLLSHHILQDNMPCHFVSAAGAGFVTTLLASPVDVVKTRFMNSTPGQYKSAIQCALRMAKTEGPQAFYKGCLPSFLRLTSWSIVMFVSYEQIKLPFSSDLPMDQTPYFNFDDMMPMVETLPSGRSAGHKWTLTVCVDRRVVYKLWQQRCESIDREWSCRVILMSSSSQ